MIDDTTVRVTTGVSGLDAIAAGGLPEGRLYLLRGAAGTGKTTLAMQFLLDGVRRGESVLYVSLSQTEEELRQMAASHGWSLDGVVVQSLATGELLSDPAQQTIFQTADLRLDRTRDAINGRIAEIAPHRVVYDSLLEIRLLAADRLRFRREILGFKSFLSDQRITALLVDTEHGSVDPAEDQLENIAHGLIQLDKRLPEYGTAQRRLELKKLRGSAIQDGWHDMSIRRGVGVEVYPRVAPGLQPDEEIGEAPVTCGVAGLDAMLGGGLEGGTTAIVIGQSGTGKSTMASLYARAALERGENVALFLFEERVETFFRRSEGLGIELRGHHAQGRLQLRDFNPSEVSPGEFSQIVVQTVGRHDVGLVVIDSLTGYLAALPEKRRAVTQIQTLLKYLARRSVLTLLVVAQHGLLGRDAESDLDVSYLGDSVILLRMHEWRTAIRRTVAIVKKRHGIHDLGVRELVIGPGDVRVEPMVAEAGTPPVDGGPQVGLGDGRA
ncbi:MAG: AAA family ATPase [Geminicoccaceae bacterium]|nr:AAA family ATPase [Geminicoccaceae bacterium]